jgi:hypothetical protein
VEGEDAPRVERLEHALTSGYARALELEAEGLRLERRIGEVAAGVGSDNAHAQELVELAERRLRARTQHDRLRGLLNRLRDRTAAARLTASL